MYRHQFWLYRHLEAGRFLVLGRISSHFGAQASRSFVPASLMFDNPLRRQPLSVRYPYSWLSTFGPFVLVRDQRLLVRLSFCNQKNCVSGCLKGPTGVVNIWSLQDGILMQTNTGTGGVHSLSWMDDLGLAACFSRSKVCILN